MFRSFLLIFCILSLGLSNLSVGEGIADPSNDPKKSGLQWKWAMESLDRFPFDEADKVLDLGCRSGSITAEISARVPSGIVIGVEIPEMMHAKEHYSVSNVIYIRADAKNLPFVEQFDKATALLCFNWIREQDLALKSLYRALKPGGKALITRPGKQPSNLGPIAQSLIQTGRWAAYFPSYEQKRVYYDADEYRALLEEAGFVIEKMGEDSTYTYFKDREALIGFFRPLCAFADHLSEDLKMQFVENVVDKVLEFDLPSADGSIQLHDFKLEAIVSKPSTR